VLLHDGECADEAENVAALDTILTELGTRGSTFAALPNGPQVPRALARGDPLGR
jgi:hypothetical protein